MDNFEINTCIDKCNVQIIFSYSGTKNKWNTNTEETKILVDRILNHYVNADCCFTKVISYLKTTLKDYKEDYFNFSYKYRDDLESINFKDYKIIEYINNNENYNISYKNGSFNINKISENISLISLSNEVINEMKKLNNDKFNELTNKQKLFIQLYKIVYKKDPDFTDNNTFHEINLMMCILHDLRLDISNINWYKYDFQFMEYPRYGCTMFYPGCKEFFLDLKDLYFEDSIFEESPYGVITLDKKDEYELDSKVVDVLNNLGEVINEVTNDTSLDNSYYITNLDKRIEKILLLATKIRLKRYKYSYDIDVHFPREYDDKYHEYSNKIKIINK